MSNGSTALTRRVLREHRRVVLPLAAALLVNVLVYALIVYPLSQRVASIEDRTRTAEINLTAARQDHARASGTLNGKNRASTELATFYEQVLPADLAGARRLTHRRLAQLASRAGLRHRSTTFDTVDQRDSNLTRFEIGMELAGPWSDVRDFIYQLETAPEFVVIDNIELSDEADDAGLRVQLALSTYYRDTTP